MSIEEKIYFPDYYKKLGKRVRKIRHSKRLSLNDLASYCHLEKTSISRIENGRTNVTFKTIIILCKALDIEIKELFDFDL